LKESAIAYELKAYCRKNYNALLEVYKVTNPMTGRKLSYDIYIPLWKIFIEVNGLQHYKYTPGWHNNMEDFNYRCKLDLLKKNYASENGTYIEIDLRSIKYSQDAIEYLESVMASLGKEVVCFDK
jgi:hypothetical protein